MLYDFIDKCEEQLLPFRWSNVSQQFTSGLHAYIPLTVVANNCLSPFFGQVL